MLKSAYRLVPIIVALLLLAAPFLAYDPVQAADIQNRRLVLGSSEPSVTTTHQLSFDYVSASNVGSIRIEYCENSPLLLAVCTPTTGLSVNSAVLSSESGETGFSVSGVSGGNVLVLTRPSVAVTPGAASYLISNIVNPSATGTSYVRVSTHAALDGTGARIDEGGIAISTSTPVDLQTYVPPILLFCLGTSIPTNNCASATGNDIDFGELSSSSTALGTTQMIAATNGVGGYSITVTGTTMTSGNNIIQPLATQTASQTNTSQFGINLMNNSSPDVGANKTGPGTGVVNNRYNDVNQFRFVNGEAVAGSPISSDINKYTTSYIVNIDGNQPPGVYSTTLTFIALATF